MDVFTAVKNRLEVRDYSSRKVEGAIQRTILDAGRLAPSGRNSQHWRFVVLETTRNIERLAELSTSGSWVRGADFAVVVCTDTRYAYHEIDAGRSLTHMQLVAWEQGVGSCIYTGYDEAGMRDFLDVPDEYAMPVVVGFGYPAKETRGEKNRKPLPEIAFRGRFEVPYE